MNNPSNLGKFTPQRPPYKLDLSKKKLTNIALIDSFVKTVSNLDILDLSYNRIERIDIEKLGSNEGVN